jgi:hypothetical protein
MPQMSLACPGTWCVNVTHDLMRGGSARTHPSGSIDSLKDPRQNRFVPSIDQHARVFIQSNQSIGPLVAGFN